MSGAFRAPGAPRRAGLLVGGLIGLLVARPAAAQVQVRHVSEKTGLASFLDVPPGARSAMTPAAFLDRSAALFGVRSPAAELLAQGAMYDELGQRHHTYAQIHAGVPVFGGRLRVHEDAAGLVAGASGEFFPLPDDLDMVPSVDRPAAAARAIQATGGTAKVSQAELTIVDPAWYGGRRLGPRLVYHVRLRTDTGEPHGLFVDAHSGEIIEQWPERQELLFRSIYVPNNSPCVDEPRFPGVLIRTEGGAPASLVDGNRAYDYLGDVYRYYAQAFGRDSLDGRGMPLLASVGPVLLGPQGFDVCPNAFWDSDLRQMLFCNGTVADDVTAHELAHGVTERTAGLYYLYQPGMLNESFSDVFGEVVDLLNGNAAAPGPPGGSPPWPGSPSGAGVDTPNGRRTTCSQGPSYADGVRWLIGEGLGIFGVDPLRDMWDPTCPPGFTYQQPDRLTSPLYPCGCGDFGGVHIGSGVLNHAFAMLVDGKTFNGHTVPGIGLIKAAAVWYQALTVYVSELSSYKGARDSLNDAAADLVNTRPLDPRTGQPIPMQEQFSQQDALAVDEALRAVEMDLSPPCQDDDGDGVPNDCDNCRFVFNPDQADSDRQVPGDACDSCTDRDRDGFGDPGFPPNVYPPDNCPEIYNPAQTDANGNGIGDACEDPDGDGVPSGRDNCPLLFNPLQEDADLDGTGDGCDPCTDTDRDGFGDPGFPHACVTDNCPNVANPSQADGDGDGVGDACGPPPANDDCSAAAVIAATPFSSAVDTRYATNEVGEPYYADPSDPARRELVAASVWYSSSRHAAAW